MAEARQDIITDEVWNELVKEFVNEGMNLAADKLAQMDEYLKQAAREFNQVYDETKVQIKNIREALKKQKDIRDGYTGGFSEMKQSASEKDLLDYTVRQRQIQNDINTVMPKIYSAVFRFQEVLNQYLGQQIRIAIVYENGEIFTGTTAQAQDLLHYDYNKTQLTARFNTDRAQVEQAFTALDWREYDRTNLARVLHGYNSAIWRWNYSRNSNNNLVKNGGKDLVMWRYAENLNRWKGMYVSSRGDISEAYATIILTHGESQFTDDMIERILDIFMQQYVGNVNPTSGMLQGDASANGIEYAIKAVDNSALGWVQFRRVANMILRKKFTRQQLEDEKARLAKKGEDTKRNRFVQDVNDQVYQELENDFNEFELNWTIPVNWLNIP